MKKLVILPVLMVCMVGASPVRNVEHRAVTDNPTKIDAKIDSVDRKFAELRGLVEKGI